MSTVTAPSEEGKLAAGQAARPNWIQRNHFILRRLHSLSGIIPLGGFLLFHFYENGAIFYGTGAYDEMSTSARGIRYLEFIEIFIVAIPLLYHALYGLFIAAYARNNLPNYTYGRNNLFMWQRATGVITLLFVLYHVWQFRLTAFWSTHADTGTVAATFSQIPIFIFYVIGIVAASFHLGNGIWAFLITWGITVGQRAQRISQVVTTAFSIAMSVFGVGLAVALALASPGGFTW